MAWYVCTLSATGDHNWEICKEISHWGIITEGRKNTKHEISKGDNVLFYRASRGFIAHGKFTGPARTPLDKSEAPWAGGVIKFGLIVPFKLTYELVNPQKLKMVNQVFSGTKVGSFTLRRGFAPISDEDGEFILDKIDGK
jgi:hypothetical protein